METVIDQNLEVLEYKYDQKINYTYHDKKSRSWIDHIVAKKDNQIKIIDI